MSGGVRALSAVSHLALWAGVYVGAGVVYAAQVAGLWTTWDRRHWIVLAYATLTSMGVYLLDRVKLRDAWLDPADRAAHPDRFTFLAERSKLVRTLAAALLIGAAALGWGISPLTGAATVLACVGVLAYAGLPRRGRARIKDVLLLKNAFVAAGITGFAQVLALAGTPGGPREWWDRCAAHAAAIALAAGTLMARVFADAALCDLDDERSDRDHGTVTLPTTLGRSRAWMLGLILRLFCAGVLLAVPLGPGPARWTWAAVTAVTSVAVWAWHPRRVRDIVDARFGVEAAVVSAVLWACANQLAAGA